MSELRTQRDRQAALDATSDRSIENIADCAAAGVGVTTTVTTYPTTAASYFALSVDDVGGPEKEGGAASYTAGAGTVFALNVGSEVPPSGTRVVYHAVGGRFVFRFDG